MTILNTVCDFLSWRKTITGSVGFVPTMGALHEGHLTLVQAANETSEHTVVSIYVNPAQFSPTEDLSNYPNTLDQDLVNLKNYQIDAVFLPTNSEMYQTGFSTYINETDISKRLEGASRPTHFSGVNTIVAKLFNIVQPTHAFFGEKDAQQLRVIQKMVSDLNYNIRIIPCKTVRESHGLARSSRNNYLTDDNRQKAGIIYQSLEIAKRLLREGEISAQEIRQAIADKITTEPQAKIDYISVADNDSLIDVRDKIKNDILVSVAVFFGSTRLIDNFTFRVVSGLQPFDGSGFKV